MTTASVVRVTIAAPTRRIDLALPERAPVAEMLPGLLRRAGQTLADDLPDGGWLLRRADGTPVDAARTLAAQHVRDGEVLHLVPGTLDWPELEYDDLVDAIADGAGRTGRRWAPRHTRLAGLTAAAPAVLLALTAVLRAGPPWPGPGRAALLVAVLLLAGGMLLARVAGDAGAGAVLAALALPAAFLAGALLLGGPLPGGPPRDGPLPGGALFDGLARDGSLPGGPLPDGAGPLLGGCAALLVAAVLAGLGVVDRLPFFVAAAVAGLLGAAAAAAVTLGWTGPDGAAAVTATVVFLFSPQLGPLAARLGRVPTPMLPRTATDLVRDDPQPSRRAVDLAVLRADALLTGMLAGGALAAAAAATVLVPDAGLPATLLLALLALGFGVRARLYPAVRHRLPVLLAAAATTAALAVAGLAGQPLSVSVPVLLAAAGLATGAALRYSRRPAGAALARYAEVLEVLLVLACVPVVCAVLQLYGLVRGLGG
ncbi:type VII secretion integral membrane protein EccD [Jidongwangia harbinensis]|uniref:type VII secretion integral membrane protein EccD n=1 Tax=Jidongwangia harbinensis TaxID=2878561 RepID=UPI001CD948A5|nr:type VII secretion integral membrane protein EccD [Jidongwangia harbinensis]MCA2218177.1 type VII secretion integral membrane protein EccD [Jidongwangia harbinensis]